MPKRPETKGRTQVKDLPKKEKKLSTGDMKKVKGGVSAGIATGQDHDALTAFRASPTTAKTGNKLP